MLPLTARVTTPAWLPSKLYAERSEGWGRPPPASSWVPPQSTGQQPKQRNSTLQEELGESLKSTSMRQRAPLKTIFHMQLEAGEEETCYTIWPPSTGGKATAANHQTKALLPAVRIWLWQDKRDKQILFYPLPVSAGHYFPSQRTLDPLAAHCPHPLQIRKWKKQCQHMKRRMQWEASLAFEKHSSRDVTLCPPSLLPL